MSTEHLYFLPAGEGLSVNVSKSASIAIEPLGKRKNIKFATEPIFKISEDFIRPITYNNTYTYLGIEFDPTGIVKYGIEIILYCYCYIRSYDLSIQIKSSTSF